VTKRHGGCVGAEKENRKTRTENSKGRPDARQRCRRWARPSQGCG